ncbi:hypothetical protein [Thalassotalea piscium]|uniref:Uncharacterized protein n=1 Tax=Thalassotalea piscium TaxID=1230533 RepID=A0A7X0NJV5_9GAMM|nr:hypothetical protein [Thalassotalea piscium]MBB6544797.1 hypothetical protein [Thalassotalea piscium]
MSDKTEAASFIQGLLNDEEAMALTINTEHKNFVGSDDERSFKSHQHNIMQFKRILRFLE